MSQYPTLDPKITSDPGAAQCQDPVLNWARFFRADTDEERHRLAMTDPTIAEAEAALKRLSSDPLAREYAYRRELERINFDNQLEEARRKAEEAERDAECRARDARRGALREALTRLCAVAGIEIDTGREARLRELDEDALQDLITTVATTRACPF